MAQWLRRVGLGVCLLAIVVLFKPQAASANAGDRWCELLPWSSPAGLFSSSIDVWIHYDAANQLLRTDNSTQWTDDEFRKTLEAAMQTINNAGIAGLPPLKFAGWESSSVAWNAPAAPGITIRPDFIEDDDPKLCTFRVAVGPANWLYGAGHKMHVGNSTSPNCTSTFYENWLFGVGAPPSLEGVLVHELEHALGLHHSFVCGGATTECLRNAGETEVCGAMDLGVLSPQTDQYTELEYNDWEGLEHIWGSASGILGLLRREFSASTSWATQTSPSVTSPIISSDWGGGSTLMPLGSLNAAGDPQFQRWSRTYNSLTNWGVPYSFGRQYASISTAASYGYRYLGFMFGASDDDARRRPRHSWHTSSTNRGVVYSDSVHAGRPGHSITWDERSGRLVHAVRRPSMLPELHTSSSTGPIAGPFYTPPAGEPNMAAYPPEISCGPSSVPYNCMMVWAGVGQASGYHTLQYAQFRILNSGDSATFDFAPTYGLGYVMYDAPKVTWTNGVGGGAGGFVVAFNNPGECAFTMTKGPMSYNGFSDLRSHCTSGAASLAPALGATASSWAEAWFPYN